jgi:murein DD-endopeptidase MepM/ murein hydrolase activator NlpD
MNDILGTSGIPLTGAGESPLDFSGIDLQGLQTGSREEKIKRIAAQFEQIMIQTLLKTSESRDKENEDSEFGMGASSYKDMSRLFLSQYLAESGGLGYQDMIRRQIEERDQQSGQSASPIQAPALKLGENRLTSPLDHMNVTSEYGWRTDPISGQRRFHQGIDLRAPLNTPVKSMLAGQVQYSGWKEGYGNVVEVRHADGLVTRYAHNSTLLVRSGDVVDSGATIALSGDSGRSTGPHVHFEVLHGQEPVNPHLLLSSASPKQTGKNAEVHV